MLGKLRAQLRGAITARLLWHAAAAAGLAAWLGLALDRWLEPPPEVRAWAFGLGGVLGLVWLGAVVAPRLLRRISDRELLALIHARHPEEAVLISTALDLREPTSSANRSLAVATQLQAEEAATRLAALRLTRSATEHGLAWFAAVTFAAAGILGAARPDLASRVLDRLALSEEPWPRRVTLAAEGFDFDSASGEWRRRALRGEPLEFAVVARVKPPGRLPRTVWSRDEQRRLTTLTRLGPQATNAIEQRYRRRIERLDEETAYVIRGGDAQLRLRLIPVDRPRLVEPEVACVPPEYLGLPPFDSEPATLTSLPEGSRIGFRARSTKPITSATATLRSADTAPRGLITELDADKRTVRINGIRSDGSSVLTVTVTDEHGFTSPPFEIALENRPDTPPTVGLELAGVGRAITRDARLPARVRVDDDHGVDEVQLRLLVSDGDSAVRSITLPKPMSLPAVSRGAADLISLRSSGGQQDLRVEPGDRLTLQASVSDSYNLKPRPPTKSTPITLEVVTRAELLGRIGDAQRELRGVVDSLRSDLERLDYEIDLARRRLSENAEDQAEMLARWSAERRLDARKSSQGVGQAASRAAELRRQVINNRLDQPALVERLQQSAAEPLRAVAEGDLRRVRAALQPIDAAPTSEALAQASQSTRRAIATLQSVAESLSSQQTYNEVVTLLRGLIREQRAVNQRTTKQQDEDARRLLFD